MVFTHEEEIQVLKTEIRLLQEENDHLKDQLREVETVSNIHDEWSQLYIKTIQDIRKVLSDSVV